VLTVWQTFDLGFVPAKGAELDAANVAQVRHAAEQTAAEGAARAETAGFQARSATIEAPSASKAIVEFADEHDAAVIVLGSHGRARLRDRLLSSVAEAVAGHTERSVLIAHCRADAA
jgi:nucleotide-binding universal stress UspA family protein